MATPPAIPPQAAVAPSMLARLRGALARSWFPAAGNTLGTSTSPTPVLDATLAGFAGVMNWAWGLIQYVRLQLYITTATGGWLDIASSDFFGSALPRGGGELDPAFRARIRANLFLPANTKAAISAALETLTGTAPRIVEPWNTGDTGVWGGSRTGGKTAGCAYWNVDTPTTPGRWTNPSLRYQFFVDATLPTQRLLGSGWLPAWDASSFWNTWSGSTPLLPRSGNEADLVYAALERVKLYGTVAWVRFSGSASSTGGTFVLGQSSLGGPDALAP